MEILPLSLYNDKPFWSTWLPKYVIILITNELID